MTAPRLPEAQVSVGELSASTGLKPTTLSNYARRGYMPAPDGHVGRTPWWWKSTVDTWLANRPGQAWRKGKTAGGAE